MGPIPIAQYHGGVRRALVVLSQHIVTFNAFSRSLHTLRPVGKDLIVTAPRLELPLVVSFVAAQDGVSRISTQLQTLTAQP